MSLRNIPDFAKKVELTSNGETILYWRWHLLSEEETINMIRGETQKRDITPQPEIKEEKQPASESKPEIKTEEQKEESEKEQETKEEPITKEKYKTEETKKTPIKTTEDKKQKIKQEEQKTIEEEPTNYEDEFYQEIKKFLEQNQIKIKKSELIRKGSDYELIISMKTPFGETEYFCKAKSKKKNNEGDLSTAYLQGQNKRLPTVFITTGEVTKKAKNKAKEEYKGLLIKEL